LSVTTDITHLWRPIGDALRRRAIVRRIEVHVKGAPSYPPIAPAERVESVQNEGISGHRLAIKKNPRSAAFPNAG
jgi:hypothetical protein